MNQWINVTNTFSESQRHYKNTCLEICEERKRIRKTRADEIRFRKGVL